MANLTAAQRRAIPKDKFGIPEKAPGPGSYPMPDKAHAIVGESLVAQHGTPAEKERVDKKAHALYPSMGRYKEK